MIASIRLSNDGQIEFDHHDQDAERDGADEAEREQRPEPASRQLPGARDVEARLDHDHRQDRPQPDREVHRDHEGERRRERGEPRGRPADRRYDDGCEQHADRAEGEAEQREQGLAPAEREGNVLAVAPRAEQDQLVDGYGDHAGPDHLDRALEAEPAGMAPDRGGGDDVAARQQRTHLGEHRAGNERLHQDHDDERRPGQADDRGNSRHMKR